MKLNRKTVLGLGLLLALASTAGTVLAARKNCEASLAACLNGGGDATTCWNAYWRCTSR